MTELGAVFLIGLLGSAHCAGMCGGFVMAVTETAGGPRQRRLHQALYFLGKTATYAVLGALAGAFGQVLGTLFTGMQNVLSITLGVFLVVIGLGLVGVMKRFEGLHFFGKLSGFSTALSWLLRRPGSTSIFGLGLLNGLLPCGLVYGMLAMAAATGSLVQGALTMGVFGLATIPALYLVALAGSLMRPVWRARFHLASGILVIVLGLITIARGVPGLLPHGHDGAAPHEHSVSLEVKSVG
jgi:hypothetical protein